MYTNQDDLGRENGSFFSQYAPEAQRLVTDWRVKSFGRRPHDWVARDILLGGVARDPRMWAYRCLRQHKPSWMSNNAPLGRDYQQIVLCRSLHYLHAMHIAKMRSYNPREIGNLTYELDRCFPSGLEVEWTGPGVRYGKDICGHDRVCPFCFTRKALLIYQRIQRGLTLNPCDGLLVRMSLTVTDHDISLEMPGSTLADRIPFVRHLLKKWLVECAKSAGCIGGVVCFQVQPYLSQHQSYNFHEADLEYHDGFKYFVSLLGEVRETHDILLDVVNDPEAFARYLDIPVVAGEQLFPKLTILHRNDPSALRLMFTGRHYGYCQSSDLPAAVPGLLHWPSWMLASYDQWKQYLDHTKGVHLFDLFGSWRHFPSVADVKAHTQQMRPLKAANRQRQDEARFRQLSQAQAVREVWIRWLAEHNGIPPGRVHFANELADANVSIGERDLRRHLKQLKQEIGNE